MEDFYCTSASQMNYGTLAQRVRHFRESEKGVARMCRSMEQFQKEILAEGRAEGHAEGHAQGHAQGLAEGKLDAIRSLMGNLGKSAEESMKLLNIPESEWENYKALLNQ